MNAPRQRRERVGGLVLTLDLTASLGCVVVSDGVSAQCALTVDVAASFRAAASVSGPPMTGSSGRLSSREIDRAQGQFTRAAIGAAEAQRERFVAGGLDD